MNTFSNVRGVFARFHEPESQHRFADIYWGVLSLTALVVSIVVIAFGVWLFFGEPVLEEQLVSERSTAGFTREDIQKLVTEIGERRQVFEEEIGGER